MSTHPRARLKNVHARMAIRQANQFPDVNPLIGTDQRQLIRKGDIHVTEAVFRQLAHFSGAGVGHYAFAFEENFVQGAGTFRADGGHTANNTIVFNQLNHDLARQHSLRTVGDVDIRLLSRLLREA